MTDEALALAALEAGIYVAYNGYYKYYFVHKESLTNTQLETLLDYEAGRSSSHYHTSIAALAAAARALGLKPDVVVVPVEVAKAVHHPVKLMAEAFRAQYGASSDTQALEALASALKEAQP